MKKKNFYSVQIQSLGSYRISVIKAIREMCIGYGLREAKELIEQPLPITVLHSASYFECQRMAKVLRKAGCTVIIEDNTNL